MDRSEDADFSKRCKAPVSSCRNSSLGSRHICHLQLGRPVALEMTPHTRVEMMSTNGRIAQTSLPWFRRPFTARQGIREV
jgi:hypothetical protein